MTTTARCGVCDRPVGAANTSLERLEVALCGRCYNRSVTIRVAAEAARRGAARVMVGVYTFYIRSLTSPETEYTVKRFRQSMTCTCPDFVHRGQVLMVPCKHVRLVRLFARAVGGFAQVPRGREVRFRLAEPGTNARRRS